MAPELQSALDDILAAGHTPEPRLVVRFGDGRLRLYPAEAERDLDALRNQYGPCEAYVVTGEGVRDCSASRSRNSAIFAASLGITTGALPKVEASACAPASCFVRGKSFCDRT